jgi:iron complex outermembrane receptor protein
MYSAGVMALLVSTGMANPAFAAAAAPESSSVEEVVVTGTRTSGVKAIDSAAPIETVGANALTKVGQPDLLDALSQNLPSFNAQGYGADAAALTLSAALRGLNPNDTLVLVDGKRRHPTSNLAVDGGSPFQGAATADLSFIPIGAIDHIEVLQDGAAAQYGSDAIAGVVNIILKTADHGGTLSATGGQYYEGDGDTGSWSVNKGIDLGGRGFVNVTAEEHYHDFSRQGGADHRFSNLDGSEVSGLGPIDGPGILAAPGYPNMNNIYGDTHYNRYSTFYNAGYNLTDDIQAYSFGSYSHRDASAFENYRQPSKIEGCTGTMVGAVLVPGSQPSGGACTSGTLVVPLPKGFSPREAIMEDDYSFTGGVRGKTAGWDWDLSTTYGKDMDKVATINSANAQLFPLLQSLSVTPLAPQRNFQDGSYFSTEWTSNIDISRNFDLGLASPLNVAFGGEQRRDTFGIGAGEPASFFGAGAQSFTGYGPTDAADHSRTSYAGYIDLAVNPITGLHVDLAGRFEHFSDFGDTEVGKFTARYDFNPMIAVRGTISSGFRAPTLAEEFYSGTNVSPAFAQVQLPPNSAAAAVAGFSPLKPEQSDNYSVGIVAHPIDKLQITLDAYEIDIRDRIVGSGFLLGSELDSTGHNVIVSQPILNAITAHGNVLDSGISYAGIQLFTNGANTKTQGVELTANYSSDFGEWGHVDWSLGYNFNETTIEKIVALPASATAVIPALGINQVNLLSRNAITALTTATPKDKVILGAFWTLSKWSVNLRETVYGPSSLQVSLNGSGTGPGATNLVIGTTAITDLDVGYKITPNLRIDIGANNLFDIRPPTVPNVANGGGVQPADGNNVYGEPDTFSPFGINGGYYYGRVTFSF